MAGIELPAAKVMTDLQNDCFRQVILIAGVAMPYGACGTTD
jgi:hypothetical protein